MAETLRSEWITQGPVVDAFERALARRCRVRHCVAMSSGTAALHAACAVAGLTPGTSGVTVPLTFSATANAMVYCGARPRFVDVTPGWPLVDLEALRRVESSEVRAVIPVDYGGHPADIDGVNEVARERGWVVIEDAAHSLGARYKGRPVGGLSDMTVLSFHPVKHITTGEGGAVLTNGDDLAAALREFRHHGIVRAPGGPGWLYDIPRLGHNFRITDFQCALGLSQLRNLSSRVARRRRIATQFTKSFRGLAGLEPLVEGRGVVSSYHIYPVQLVLDELRVGRRRVFDALRAEGIGVQVHYIPVHFLAYYRKALGHRPKEFPRAEAFYEREVTLPLFDGMTEADVRDVTEATSKVLAYYAK